ncbi:MAG: hypothetical protein O7G29_00375 [Acidobacteria bacterium]|nr:hypothetical protein [Acidobacteriota bacterium]
MNYSRLLGYATFFLVSGLLLEATQPARWTTSQQSEFLQGEFNGVSVTSDGKLILAPALEAVLDSEEAFIYAAVMDKGGNLYLGTGNNGKIFRVNSRGSGTEWARLEYPGVYALTVDSTDRIYAGAGPDGKVYRMNDRGEAQVFFDPDEKYIWTLAMDAQNNLFVGTGPTGVIYKVNPQGEGDVFYDSRETHITALEWDLEGNLLAGTAPGGLLFRISSNGSPFVIYDSPLQEIKAITVDRYGSIYAAALSRLGDPDHEAVLQSPAQTSRELSPTTAAGEVTVRISGTEEGSLLEIYKVDKEGLVDLLYASNDELAFDLLMRNNGNLLVGTGNKGRIISIDSRKFVTFLTQTPEEQVTQLLERQGTLYAATSNLGRVFQLLSRPSSVGVYESKVLDATMLASWGMIEWRMSNNTYRLVKVYTRSGNTEGPDQTWSDWSASYSDPSGSHIQSVPARFLQWKMEFLQEGETTALTSQRNAVESVTISYIQRNMSPQLTSLTIHAPGLAFIRTVAANPAGGVSPGGPDQAHLRSLPRAVRDLGTPSDQPPPRQIYSAGAQSISWTAEDLNSDDLTYSLYYRSREETRWRLLEADLLVTYYTIDGVSFPDGVYFVKVVVTDRVSNPAAQALEGELVSKSFVIANSSPVLELGVPQVEGTRATLQFSVHTRGSVIHQAEYSVDAGRWNILFPEDGIADSDSEQYTVGIESLEPGEHAITLRVVDSVGNFATGKTTVSIR